MGVRHKFSSLTMVMVGMFGLKASCQTAGPNRPPTVTVHLLKATRPISIPNDFLGFSFEAGTLTDRPAYLSVDNKVLIQLIRNLKGSVVRVGGNSSDKLQWMDGLRTPGTGKDVLTASDIDVFADFIKALNHQCIVGLNLGTGSATQAADEAAYLKFSLGKFLYACQLSNEPDLFYKYIRPATYAFNDFYKEWSTFAPVIQQKFPDIRFAGPDVASDTSWITRFADENNHSVGMLDGHYYRLHGNVGNVPAEAILPPDTALVPYLTLLAARSEKYGLPFRISECNSISRGGRKGSSDVFASALWGLDFMWQVAGHGGAGVNFHGGKVSNYAPIVMDYGVMHARPLYYGMLAFNYVAPGSLIVPARLSANQYNCSAYACTRSGRTYITIINKDSVPLNFIIKGRQGCKQLKVFRLTAPSLSSESAVEFAGATIDANGTFLRKPAETLTVYKGVPQVALPAYSAAVITYE